MPAPSPSHVNPAAAGDAVALVPAALARRLAAVPLRLEAGGELVVATHAAASAAARREIAFATGRRVRTSEVAPEELERLLGAAYPEEAGAAGPTSGAAPLPVGSIVALADALIARAATTGASDVHVEPHEDMVRVRYRLDGRLHTAHELPVRERDELTARLKIMAGLDIAEKRRPQDGRIRFAQGGRLLDLRVSTLPTTFGEKIVLRLLDASGGRLDLAALGLDAARRAQLARAIGEPYGMILVTGPTGSGKTTTLYAALEAIRSPEINILTVEDPVEYHLPGINQTHVRSDIGLTFAQALRAFLRQDPDVIMVGEVRDGETAEIATRAALTGHLVLSTLHTNDAPSAVARLIDMGVAPFLVAASLRMVVAQRLVRRLCPSCRAEAPPEAAARAELGLPAEAVLYRAVGCPACSGTGYRGRIALFEVMALTEEMAQMIGRPGGALALRQAARAAGMQTLRESAREHLVRGVTSPEEVLRETPSC